MLAVGGRGHRGLKTVAQAFAGVFGPTADTQVMDQIGYPIGASDTDNGVTVTAEAILFDGYNYLMTYSIAREDGTAFSVEEIPQGGGQAEPDLGQRGQHHWPEHHRGPRQQLFL